MCINVLIVFSRIFFWSFIAPIKVVGRVIGFSIYFLSPFSLEFHRVFSSYRWMKDFSLAYQLWVGGWRQLTPVLPFILVLIEGTNYFATLARTTRPLNAGSLGRLYLLWLLKAMFLLNSRWLSFAEFLRPFFYLWCISLYFPFDTSIVLCGFVVRICYLCSTCRVMIISVCYYSCDGCFVLAVSKLKRVWWLVITGSFLLLAFPKRSHFSFLEKNTCMFLSNFQLSEGAINIWFLFFLLFLFLLQ